MHGPLGVHDHIPPPAEVPMQIYELQLYDASEFRKDSMAASCMGLVNAKIKTYAYATGADGTVQHEHIAVAVTCMTL